MSTKDAPRVPAPRQEADTAFARPIRHVWPTRGRPCRAATAPAAMGWRTCQRPRIGQAAHLRLAGALRRSAHGPRAERVRRSGRLLAMREIEYVGRHATTRL